MWRHGVNSLLETAIDPGILVRIMAQFVRYIGIDYSGAEVPTAPLPGLRIYSAGTDSSPGEVPPPVPRQKYWTRRLIAHWLRDVLRDSPPVIVGIDHAFSFPAEYFKKYGVSHRWSEFLDDFESHWPTNSDHMYVDFVRDGLRGKGAARTGSSRWRRLAEIRTRTAKSVFHFDVPGSVAKATHAGLPWLRFLRHDLGDQVHFWPFDGWTPLPGRSVIAEVYPALWIRRYPLEGGNLHQRDAHAVAAWLRDADHTGVLAAAFAPSLTEEEKVIASYEGWILGVG